MELVPLDLRAGKPGEEIIIPLIAIHWNRRLPPSLLTENIATGPSFDHWLSFIFTVQTLYKKLSSRWGNPLLRHQHSLSWGYVENASQCLVTHACTRAAITLSATNYRTLFVHYLISKVDYISKDYGSYCTPRALIRQLGCSIFSLNGETNGQTEAGRLIP